MGILTKEEFDYQKKKVLDSYTRTDSSGYKNYQTFSSNVKTLTTGLKVAIVLIPLIGIIMYFVEKEEEPAYKKEIIIYTVAGFILGLMLWIFI